MEEQELLKYLLEWLIHLPISFILLLYYLIFTLAEYLLQTAFEKQWRRKSFIKYLDNEDIEMINYYLSDTYLTSINCQETVIGRVILNAYNKDIELKKIRKEQWNKLKFWKKKDS